MLERIKRLHKKCGFLDTENLFMLTFNWLNHLQVTDVNVDILENFYYAFRTPKYFLLRNILRVGIPKFTVLVIIFRVFMWPLSLINAGPRSITHWQCINMVSPKRRDNLLQELWKIEFLRHNLILPQHPREGIIAVTRLNPKWKIII